MALLTNTPQSYDTSLLRENIVFLGTGYVSLESLKALSKSFDIELVITKSDRSTSSGKTRPTRVKSWAQDQGIDVAEADTKQALKQLFTDRFIQSRIAVIVDFGVLVPEDIINYFPLGIVNSHFSILPEWRGADPITYALLSGQQTTGVSIMLIDPGLDTGELLFHEELEIKATDTIDTLTDKLISLNNKLLPPVLERYMSGLIKAYGQSETGRQSSYSQKIKKSDGVIDWNQSAGVIERQIRAYAGWPKSQTQINGSPVVIHAAVVTDIPAAEPGQIEVRDNQLLINAQDVKLKVLSLQPLNKAKMDARSYINGYVNS